MSQSPLRPRSGWISLGFGIALSFSACNPNSAPSTTGSILSKSADGRIHVSFPGKPVNLTCLDPAPSIIEPELMRGKWLVIVFLTMSTRDVKVAATSDDLAKKLNGITKVAIRPMQDIAEARKWIPGYDDIDGITLEEKTASPLWLLMEGGVVKRWYRGTMEDAEIIDFANDQHSNK